MENKKNVLLEKDTVPLEIALTEIQEVILFHNFEKVSFDKIEEDYPQLLTAIKKGLMSFDLEKKPKYNLAFPIILEDDALSIKEVNFRTRIKPLDLVNITKGINMSKEQHRYILACLAYLSGLSTGELNKLNKFDYKVIEQMSTVFF